LPSFPCFPHDVEVKFLQYYKLCLGLKKVLVIVFYVTGISYTKFPFTDHRLIYARRKSCTYFNYFIDPWKKTYKLKLGRGKECAVVFHIQSPSNEVGFNNVQDLLFCFTVVKITLFFPLFPWEKQLQRNSRSEKTRGDTLTYESFHILQLCSEATSIHTQHHTARQNLLLSHCETVEGKLSTMKGVGWLEKSGVR